MAAKRKKAAKKKRARKKAKARGYRPRRFTREDRTRAARVVQKLYATYPDVECALDHRDAYELTAATILSAQCTDERVNMVTPELFARYPTPAALARADQLDVEDVVRSTGFFRNKAKNLIGMGQRVSEAYGGEVPQEMDDLLTLPGVARKTANVVRGVIWGKADGVVVDTHVKRISGLLGWTRRSAPEQIERDLMALHPQEVWIDLSHMLIHHGRRICIARRPRCDECPLATECPSAGM
ncbi:MAG: endonuclease III [Planctomycetota bacterium]|nr:endonuclease III [Planctomycetota bacterium]